MNTLGICSQGNPMSELKENQSPPTSPKRFGLISKIVFASLLLLGSLNCFKERFFRVYGPSDPRLPCIANLKMIDGAVCNSGHWKTGCPPMPRALYGIRMCS